MGITSGLPMTPSQFTTAIAFILLVGSLVDKFKSDCGVKSRDIKLLLFTALLFSGYELNSIRFKSCCKHALLPISTPLITTVTN
ncbi:MAG: hypothetical protein L7S45_06910, partial [Luminiphilus sp.]|nr:hypothetical protein [Luminiphilus sp.]